MSAGMRALTGLMGVLFLVAALLQYNDPDPLRWMAIYGAAAVACLGELRGRRSRRLPVVVALVAALWAATLAPTVAGRVAPGELFREFGMTSLAVEEAREMLGLLIVALWMLALLARRAARPDASGSEASARPLGRARHH